MSDKISYAIQTQGLGKRYGSFWALQDCSVDVPKGSVTALVGPNGAGKTTFLKLLTSLAGASSGTAKILGEQPTQSGHFLAEVGYLAQEIPLYRQMTAQDYINMGANLNERWDQNLMESRLKDLSIPLDRPVGKLSGGQRAQVALAMALAKKPKVLLLDEPVAALDPLARRDFLSSLAQAVATTDLTVVMSSHLLADLEFICDRVIIVADGRVQLSNDIEQVLQTHKLLVGPRKSSATLDPAYSIIQETHTERQSTLLVKIIDKKLLKNSGWQSSDVTIEDVVLAYMSQHKGGTE